MPTDDAVKLVLCTTPKLQARCIIKGLWPAQPFRKQQSRKQWEAYAVVPWLAREHLRALHALCGAHALKLCADRQQLQVDRPAKVDGLHSEHTYSEVALIIP